MNNRIFATKLAKQPELSLANDTEVKHLYDLKVVLYNLTIDSGSIACNEREYCFRFMPFFEEKNAKKVQNRGFSRGIIEGLKAIPLPITA